MVLSYQPAPAASNLPTVMCQSLNVQGLGPSDPHFELAIPRESTPPNAGAIVTFKYRDVSRVTRQPTYKGLLRVHNPASCDCEFCSQHD